MRLFLNIHLRGLQSVPFKTIYGENDVLWFWSTVKPGGGANEIHFRGLQSAHPTFISYYRLKMLNFDRKEGLLAQQAIFAKTIWVW